MKKSLILGVVVAAGFIAGEAQAFDTFIPMGFGYSTANSDPSMLSAAERKAIAKADIYETDIYQRQLHARQTDSRMSRFMSDRNSDGTENFPEY
ncbi:hypothetical protein [Aestuariivirga litoralis]|uniref:hypothetical protein n=1 Tax=Aestuariivirga litoralis TaxID=2650924 RepID=UPI0018C6A7CF|nr:hypothetical protein [Aestuariivirga litoralis]MBG1231498.1 hypothetical protein [Aestuariivirga litoralis]